MAGPETRVEAARRPGDAITSIGRVFFAIALAGLGVEHFIFRDFVTGRAPAWPESIPGSTIWAYVTGIAFIGVGLAIVASRKARLAAVLGAVLILGYALLRHIPVIAADTLLAPTWTSAGKALAFFGGALAIAGTLPNVEGGRGGAARLINLNREFIIIGRVTLGVFLVITGIQHYMFTEFVATLVPAWIPGSDVFWTYAAGVALIAGGVGLHLPKTSRLAARLSGLMVFSWFWIVHVPRTFDGRSSAIAVFEALAVSGIAFVLAGSGYVDETRRKQMRLGDER